MEGKGETRPQTKAAARAEKVDNPTGTSSKRIEGRTVRGEINRTTSKRIKKKRVTTRKRERSPPKKKALVLASK